MARSKSISREPRQRGQDDIIRGWSRGWPSPASSRTTAGLCLCISTCLGGSWKLTRMQKRGLHGQWKQFPWLWHLQLRTGQRRWIKGTQPQRSRYSPWGREFPRGKQCVLHCWCPGQGSLKNQAEQTDMKTLPSKELCGPCPGTPSLSPGHRPRDMNTKLSESRERGWKALGHRTTTQTLAERGLPSNPETQTAQDDPCAQMAMPPLH